MLRPLLLTASGFALAFGPLLLGAPDLPVYVPLAVMAAGAAWALWTQRRKKPRRWWLALAPAVAGGAFAAWYFLLAAYDAPSGVPEPGETAPDASAVRVRDGARFRLAAQRGHGVLLVFFRGSW